MTAFSVLLNIPSERRFAAVREAVAVPDGEFLGRVFGRATPKLEEGSALLELTSFLHSPEFMGPVQKTSGVDLKPDASFLSRRAPKKYHPSTIVSRRDGLSIRFFCHLVISGDASILVRTGGAAKTIPLEAGVAYVIPYGEGSDAAFEVRETLYTLDMPLWGAPLPPPPGRPKGFLMKI